MDVGIGEGVRVGSGVREAVAGGDVKVGVSWFDGEQAQTVVRSVNSVVISFVA